MTVEFIDRPVLKHVERGQYSLCAGRLHIEQFDEYRGDSITLLQTHRNGSSEVVGEITLDGDEIEDALYLLQRAKGYRK